MDLRDSNIPPRHCVRLHEPAYLYITLPFHCRNQNTLIIAPSSCILVLVKYSIPPLPFAILCILISYLELISPS